MIRRKKILILNPNSNESVTDGLRKALTAGSANTEVSCETLVDGPFGIESDKDIECVAPLVVARLQNATNYDACVIACYSDPGLELCRQTIAKPVFGMQQSALETAVARGGKFGVLALSNTSIERHLDYIDKLGFADKLAGELPLDVSVDQAANDPETIKKIVAQGRRLIEEYGATALILGCAGMAQQQHAAEAALKVPVIEPTKAALHLAIEAA